MDTLNNNVSPEETKTEKIGRRDILKTIAATSGAVVAASMLPSKWAKPVVEAGVLPAHAQGSPGAPPAVTESLSFNIQPAGQYNFRFFEPGSNTPMTTNTLTNPPDGQYRVEAQYIGAQPPPSPDPRPVAIVTDANGNSVRVAPSTFNNDGQNFYTMGTFNYPNDF